MAVMELISILKMSLLSDSKSYSDRVLSWKPIRMDLLAINSNIRKKNDNYGNRYGIGAWESFGGESSKTLNREIIRGCWFFYAPKRIKLPYLVLSTLYYLIFKSLHD